MNYAWHTRSPKVHELTFLTNGIQITLKWPPYKLIKFYLQGSMSRFKILKRIQKNSIISINKQLTTFVNIKNSIHIKYNYGPKQLLCKTPCLTDHGVIIIELMKFIYR